MKFFAIYLILIVLKLIEESPHIRIMHSYYICIFIAYRNCSWYIVKRNPQVQEFRKLVVYIRDII